MKSIVEKLIKKNKTISVMESCTGGGIANAITNVEDSSNVFKFGAVTYSNKYKIKIGVSKEVIEKYSVYSAEVAMEMSYNISKYADADYGIGVTGKLNKIDKNNLFSKDNLVFISIYDKNNNKYYNEKLEVIENTRINNKKEVINKVIDMLNKII